ncbi:hypothetical protein BG003_004719 [Podila horticola]|nr:hypothetical protein BG003_004719 [Podila horticola]
MGTGPKGVPLLHGATNQPAILSGQVLFENNYEAKGDDITIEYSAIASAGKYCVALNITIDPAFPSSSITTHGWMTYKIVATLHRKCPSTNVVTKTTIWVLNTFFNRLEPGLPIATSKFNGTFDKMVPYVCLIPSGFFHLGQKVPVTFKAFPTLNNGAPLTFVSAIVKLKQYTSLKAGIETWRDSKGVLIVANDVWPAPIHGQP